MNGGEIVCLFADSGWKYLSLGVWSQSLEQARETVLAANDQLRQAEELIRQARKAHGLSETRLKNNILGASYGEVLAALKGIASAQENALKLHLR